MMRAKLGSYEEILYATGIFYKNNVRNAFNKMIDTTCKTKDISYWRTRYNNSKDLEELDIEIEFTIPEGFSTGCKHCDQQNYVINIFYDKAMEKLYFFEDHDNSTTYDVSATTFKEIADHINQHQAAWVKYAKDYTINVKNLQTNIMLDLTDIIEHIESAFSNGKIKCTVDEDFNSNDVLDDIETHSYTNIDFNLVFDGKDEDPEELTLIINNTALDPDETKYCISVDYDSRFEKLLTIMGKDNDEFKFNTYKELNEIAGCFKDMFDYVNKSAAVLEKYVEKDID